MTDSKVDHIMPGGADVPVRANPTQVILTEVQMLKLQLTLRSKELANAQLQLARISLLNASNATMAATAEEEELIKQIALAAGVLGARQIKVVDAENRVCHIL